MMTLRLTVRGVIVALLASTTAWAQQPEEATPTAAAPMVSAQAATPSVTPSAPPTAVVSVIPVAPTPAPAPPIDPTSDHDKLAHHIGVGYFGASLLPIAIPPAGQGVPPTGGTVTAPAIGARYWFSRRLGLDAGFGIGFTAGSQTLNSTSMSTPSSFGLDVHVGLPVAVVSSSHYVFEIVPESLIGFTTGKIPGTVGAASQSLDGFLFNIGGRVGCEIHFGFIGIPQLALQASIGVYFSHTSFGWSQSTNSSSVQSNTLATSVETSPWGVFVDNISALYYL
jgi:hypothetical protein